MADRLPRVFLGQPGYSLVTAGAARGFWRATRLPDDQVFYKFQYDSLLASNFNALWCTALNLARGDVFRPDYFAMIHADVEPSDWWLDALIEELEARDLDVLGVVIPIKTHHGVTSIALQRPDGDTWRPLCRLTMAEVYRLPETFTSEDVGHPILLNTGLWVCRFGDWASQVRFTINDRIVRAPDGSFFHEVEPEDWYFSRLCHGLGLRVGATRKVPVIHSGPAHYPSDRPWGTWQHDENYVESSPIPDDLPGWAFPHDVDGWLSHEEGRQLARLAKGKRVLEIGSYCGRSTICMAQTANCVLSVDPHDGRGTDTPRDTAEDFTGNLYRYKARNVGCLIGTFDNGLPPHHPDVGGPFDLIFVDAAHDAESVTRDIEAALPLLAPGGVLAFHDYANPAWPGVAKAVDSLLLSRGGELLSLTDTLAAVKPPAALLET